MTIPTTNVTLTSIQTEFGGSGSISLSEYYRGGSLVPSGTVTSGVDGVPISTSGTIRVGMFRGVSNITTINLTISSNTANYDLYSAAGSPTGPVNLTLTINSGIYVYSATNATPALSVSSSFVAGSTITIINNGFIVGAGGVGGLGGGNIPPYSTLQAGQDGAAGGTAILANTSIVITNNGTIAGGGGAGGGGGGFNLVGAGGGRGGYGAGGVTSSPGTGTNGEGGTFVSNGGGTGGTASNDGASTTTLNSNAGAAGGGGGWGAGGGDGATSTNGYLGGKGGRPGAAVVGPGTVTWNTVGTVYGPRTPASTTISLVASANTSLYDLWVAANRPSSAVTVTLTINSSIFVYGTASTNFGLDTGKWWYAGTTLSIINNGYITGSPGAQNADNYNNNGEAGFPGGTALRVRYPVSITNNNIIAGGGGSGGAGGTVEWSGDQIGGGWGGRGMGGTFTTAQAGQSGDTWGVGTPIGGAGTAGVAGTAGNVGGNGGNGTGTHNAGGGGGGGGWGAAGGSSGTGIGPSSGTAAVGVGGAGGAATITLNTGSNTGSISWTVTGTRYGTVA